MSTQVEYQLIDNHIALVTLNRPKQRNSISPKIAVTLHQIFNQIKADDHIRVVIITGTGSCFCAGVDLGKVIHLSTGAIPPQDEWDEAFLENLNEIMSTVFLRDFDIGKPVIAAINGHAIAGGMEIVMGCDIRVATPEAKFGLQEVKWALLPSGGGCVRLPRQLPYAIGMELLLTGKLVSGEYLGQYGFINHLVPTDQVLETAMGIAKVIAENGPVAVQYARKTVKETNGMVEKEAMDIELAHRDIVIGHPDAIEGPMAFMERRKPVWTNHFNPKL
eukprot:TRINITY_DN5381_c0_g2_i1.p1 TRINITY_DN5381_c0_g2~~TRINITY_DN5381_c0_g2_i1.p1  ORF type:complete len:287 (+),score=43.66 TRINITY_DN5381_c0_g2_i1:35-862(+)